jgi:hypothetical protein
MRAAQPCCAAAFCSATDTSSSYVCADDSTEAKDTVFGLTPCNPGIGFGLVLGVPPNGGGGSVTLPVPVPVPLPTPPVPEVPATLNAPLDDELMKLASPEYEALTEYVPAEMFGLVLGEQEAESSVFAVRVHEELPPPTRKVTEPVGAPLNWEETVATRVVAIPVGDAERAAGEGAVAAGGFNDRDVVAFETMSVPGTNANA